MKSIDIRIAKKDAAFVYAILESWEGLAAFSTLTHRAEDGVELCRLRLWSDPTQEEDLRTQLAALATQAFMEFPGDFPA